MKRRGNGHRLIEAMMSEPTSVIYVGGHRISFDLDGRTSAEVMAEVWRREYLEPGRRAMERLIGWYA